MARFNARCDLDLKQIAFGIRHAEYNPRKHSSITVRLFNPRVTALIRASGAITLSTNAGCSSEDDLKRSAKKLARLIQRCGHDAAKFADFAVTSILCKATLGFPVRLDVLASRFRKNALYEPEFFNSCVFRTRKPRCTFLVTAGGKATFCTRSCHQCGTCKVATLVVCSIAPWSHSQLIRASQAKSV
ncbi:tbpA [Symbiodinium natans]|uniref:TbpA protein n=1 Tax=Symbiodinium natans TaxID=878477 RepID=A0A812RJW3_9DINO|nr:tbpA [Symbiodinium natans]